MWCFPNISVLFFHPLRFGCPMFFFREKKKSENSSPRGLAQSHTSKLETYPTSPRPPRPLNRFGEEKVRGSHMAGLHLPQNGPCHLRKWWLYSAIGNPVYLQTWIFKACISPALKRIAIFSIHSVNAWCPLSQPIVGCLWEPTHLTSGHCFLAVSIAIFHQKMKRYLSHPNSYLEPKWGPLFWLEFRPCFGGLTFKNRGHLGSR